MAWRDNHRDALNQPSFKPHAHSRRRNSKVALPPSIRCIEASDDGLHEMRQIQSEAEEVVQCHYQGRKERANICCLRHASNVDDATIDTTSNAFLGRSINMTFTQLTCSEYRLLLTV